MEGGMALEDKLLPSQREDRLGRAPTKSTVRGNGLGRKEKELPPSQQADKWGLNPSFNVHNHSRLITSGGRKGIYPGKVCSRLTNTSHMACFIAHAPLPLENNVVAVI